MSGYLTGKQFGLLISLIIDKLEKGEIEESLKMLKETKNVKK